MTKRAHLLAALAALLLALLARTGVRAQDPTPTLAPPAEPVMGSFDPASVEDVDLSALPIIPALSDTARAILLDSLAQGRDPRAFAKVGDCMTEDPAFLYPLAEDEVIWGEYEALEATLDFYSEGNENPFGRKSQAAAGGFNAASVIDSLWANPEFCEAGETPLACELRLMQPSVALIMFGTNDVYYLDEAQFDYFLRSALVETITAGTLPVLSTFPLRPEFPEKTELYNRIVARAAEDYDIPLINLWRALEPLPHQGVDPDDTTHLTSPEAGSAAQFTDAALQSGFAVRNLLTLQMLEQIRLAVSEVAGAH